MLFCVSVPFFDEDNLLRNFEGNLTCPSGPTWSHSRSCAGALVAQVAWAEDLWSPLPCWYQAIPCHAITLHYTTIQYNSYIYTYRYRYTYSYIYIYVCVCTCGCVPMGTHMFTYLTGSMCVYKCIYIYIPQTATVEYKSVPFDKYKL